jgi:phospholipase C
MIESTCFLPSQSTSRLSLMLVRALCCLALAVSTLAIPDESHKPKPEPGPKPGPKPPKKPGLEQIKHVIFLMMENRSFDHYFGSLRGVRGFKDPNVQVNPDDVKQGLPNVFYQ